jgi:hypothetical protein
VPPPPWSGFSRGCLQQQRRPSDEPARSSQRTLRRRRSATAVDGGPLGHGAGRRDVVEHIGHPSRRASRVKRFDISWPLGRAAACDLHRPVQLQLRWSCIAARYPPVPDVCPTLHLHLRSSRCRSQAGRCPKLSSSFPSGPTMIAGRPRAAGKRPQPTGPADLVSATKPSPLCAALRPLRFLPRRLG